MQLKIVYVIVRRLLSLVVLVFRGDRAKDAELLVLRHENAVLRRHVGRVRYEKADRVWFAALARLIPRMRWTEVFPVTPATLLAWHRKLAAKKYDTSRQRAPGRPPTVRSIARLVVRLGKENPRWGYRRIHGELTKLGVTVAQSTVWEIPRAAGIDPTPRRSGPTWRQFMHAQAAGILAVDFFHVDTVLPKRLYVLVFIEHGARRMIPPIGVSAQFPASTARPNDLTSFKRAVPTGQGRLSPAVGRGVLGEAGRQPVAAGAAARAPACCPSPGTASPARSWIIRPSSPGGGCPPRRALRDRHFLRS